MKRLFYIKSKPYLSEPMSGLNTEHNIIQNCLVTDSLLLPSQLKLVQFKYDIKLFINYRFALF